MDMCRRALNVLKHGPTCMRARQGYALVDDNAFMVETAPIVKCSIDNDMTESTPMFHI